jgi:hypothetical protein
MLLVLYLAILPACATDLLPIKVPSLMMTLKDDGAELEDAKQVEKQIKKLSEYSDKTEKLAKRHEQMLAEAKRKFRGSKLFEATQAILDDEQEKELDEELEKND